MRFNHVTIFVTELDRSIRFYEALGLVLIVHAAPRYARFWVPANNATFSVEVPPGAKPAVSDPTHFYFECDDLDSTFARLSSAGLSVTLPPTEMDYLWREAHLQDPDGHQIRLYSAGINRLYPPWRLRDSSHRDCPRLSRPDHLVDDGNQDVHFTSYTGDRAVLLPLFELADDSAHHIEQYISLGEVIVAESNGYAHGHAQIVERGAGVFELKSIAVSESCRGLGLGRHLLREAVQRCQAKHGQRLIVSTAASSLKALGFYLRSGFRVTGIVKDAFGPNEGYAAGLDIDGIPLNDALNLARDL